LAANHPTFAPLFVELVGIRLRNRASPGECACDLADAARERECLDQLGVRGKVVEHFEIGVADSN
jgi:hypothetical protein